MGIFDRLSTLIRSNISDLIARAENPEKMLNQLIVDMRSQLAKAKQQVAGAIADEKRLAAQVEQEKRSAGSRKEWPRWATGGCSSRSSGCPSRSSTRSASSSTGPRCTRTSPATRS